MSNTPEDWLRFNASEYEIGGKVYRNLEAQVLKNMRDIIELKASDPTTFAKKIAEEYFKIVAAIVSVENGFEITFTDQTIKETLSATPAMTLPLKGSDNVVVDVTEEGDGIRIDLDESVTDAIRLAKLVWRTCSISVIDWDVVDDHFEYTAEDEDILETSNIIGSPAPDSIEKAVEYGVYISETGLNSITFRAKTLPADDIDMVYAIQI